MHLRIWFALFICGISGCRSVPTAPLSSSSVKPTQQSQAALIKPQAGISQALTQPPPPNLANTVALCNQVQQNSQVPVSCAFHYLKDGSPAILALFPNMDYANIESNDFAENLGIPFCVARAQGDRRGALLEEVPQTSASRTFNCDTGRWGDWYTYDFQALLPQGSSDSASSDLYSIWPKSNSTAGSGCSCPKN